MFLFSMILICSSLKNKTENNSTWEGAFYESEWVKINSTWEGAFYKSEWVKINSSWVILVFSHSLENE